VINVGVVAVTSTLYLFVVHPIVIHQKKKKVVQLSNTNATVYLLFVCDKTTLYLLNLGSKELCEIRVDATCWNYFGRALTELINAHEMKSGSQCLCQLRITIRGPPCSVPCIIVGKIAL